MKKLSILFFCLFYLSMVSAQNEYARVRVFANDEQLQLLESIGIPTDHGSRKQNTWLDTDLSEFQIQQLSEHNFQYEILIQDVQAYYIERSTHSIEEDRNGCDQNNSSFEPLVPSNFHLGTYAGFFTYQEFLDELDEMVAAYPNLITTKAHVDTFLTHENRPLYWVKISDNPNTDEAEPHILYTAIHHAREPASLSQLIFYMWYLLENYANNPEIAHIINETELYFIPVINPDGYIENETSNPNGGGMHRKNKRNVGTTNPGVDLNRNYDYHWNVSGTSPNVNNDTYAGTGAFSEPETQAIKHFCENHNFKFALNAHSYGNLLLFPYGYATAAFASEHDYFQTFSNHQVMFNNYNATKASNLYPAAGDSDDWMYDGDLATKPKIYALTPETGSSSDGFWPAQDRILPICKENVWPNTILGHLPHIYGSTTDLSERRIEVNSGYFSYEYQRLGLTNGPVTISIQPIQNIVNIGNSNTHTINLMDIITDSISFTLQNGLSFGDEIKYVLNTDFGGWTRHDTITKIYGIATLFFSDNANNLNNWSGNWDLTNTYFVSPSTSITDSHGSDYSNGDNKHLTLNQTFDLQMSTYAYVQFYARWEIENDYDYAQFMISTDNGANWTPLCGNYTNTGTNNQDENQPLYDNSQTDWVLEEIDVSDYIGQANVQFRFRLISDNFVTEDGFAFDDFKLLADGQDLSINSEALVSKYSIYPNPADNYFLLENNHEVTSIHIYNQLNQLVLSPVIENGRVEIENLTPGVYYVRLSVQNGYAITKKLIVSR